jgi:hypothetical protein
MLTQRIEIPYCEDCKWFGGGNQDLEHCSHPLLDEHNRVTRKANGAYCHIERRGDGRCGPSAKYYTAREVIKVPMPKRIPWWRRMFP